MRFGMLTIEVCYGSPPHPPGCASIRGAVLEQGRARRQAFALAMPRPALSDDQPRLVPPFSYTPFLLIMIVILPPLELELELELTRPPTRHGSDCVDCL